MVNIIIGNIPLVPLVPHSPAMTSIAGTFLYPPVSDLCLSLLYQAPAVFRIRMIQFFGGKNIECVDMERSALLPSLLPVDPAALQPYTQRCVLSGQVVEPTSSLYLFMCKPFCYIM